MRENVFETNEHGGFYMQVRELELDGCITGSEAPLNRREPFHKRQPAYQRNIFPKDDEGSLPIAVYQPALGIDQKTAIKIICVIRTGLRLARFGVIRTDNHPYVIGLCKTSEGFESFFVVTQHLWHGRLVPHHQAGSFGQSLRR